VAPDAEQIAQLVNPIIEDRLAAQHKAFQDTTERERKLTAIERLTDLHEDWRTVVGPAESHTPFRQWLATKGLEYQEQVLDSWNPREVAKALKEFKSLTPPKPSAPKGPSTRSQLLAEAVPARGGSPAPVRPREKTEKEAFAEGFANG
jgi:hypothetical protein